MQRLIAVILGLVVLAGAGFVAYRMGWLPGLPGTTTLGEPPLAAATTASPSPGEAGGAASGAPSPGNPSGTPATSGSGAQAPAASAVPSAALGAPIPPGLVAVAEPGQPISNKSIEVRVTDLRTAQTVGSRSAPDGREFVIVGMSWKSLVPPQKVNRKKAQDRTAGMGSLGFGGGATSKDKADDEANTTLEQVPFEMGPLAKHVWLIADGRYAAEIDADATNATDGHLDAEKLQLPAQNAVKAGALVYEAPANAQSLALLVLDTVNGHLLVPIKGAPPVLAIGLGGASKSNELMDLAVAGTSWSEAASPTPGAKTLVVTLKGISRQNAIADIPFGEFGFLQTDAGCIAQPERPDRTITKPFSPKGSFIPFVPTEGQLSFIVPADTQSATLLLRLRQGASLDLPVLGDGSAQKPPVVASHDDGKVLRVGIVAANAPPEGLPAPRAGLEYVVVDYLVENLTAGTGVELQPAQQLSLDAGDGKSIPPDRASQRLPCRLVGRNVVPAGGWRRFSLLYAVPPGQPLTLKYRGFESEGTLKVR